MDIVGPYPEVAREISIFVLCDYATQYPEAVPMKSVDAESVAEEMVQMFARVDLHAPEEILTDQGSNFTCQLLAEMYRWLHVHSTRTSPYHPETDGVVVRFNQTVKSMLQKVAIQEGKGLAKMIPCLLKGSTELYRFFSV